jgi:hypothetical protein
MSKKSLDTRAAELRTGSLPGAAIVMLGVLYAASLASDGRPRG